MFHLKRTHHYQQQQTTEDGLTYFEEEDSGGDEVGLQERKGRFTRRWTRNGELCDSSGGVILSRATFLGLKYHLR